MERRAHGAALDLEMARDVVVAEAVVVPGHDDRALAFRQLPQCREQVGPVGDGVERRCLGCPPLRPALMLDASPATLPKQLAGADDEQPRSRPVQGREALLMRFHERLLCRVFGRIAVAPDGQQRPQQAWVLEVIELAPTVGHLLLQRVARGPVPLVCRGPIDGRFPPTDTCAELPRADGQVAHARRR